MEGWGDERSQASDSKKNEANARKQAAIGRVEEAMVALKQDEFFQTDLKDPAVIRAINHWTGKQRLPPAEANKFQDNYQVMAVLQKVRRLQATCRDAGFGVPLDRVLKGEVTLGFDPYAQEEKKKAGVGGQQKQQKAAGEKKAPAPAVKGGAEYAEGKVAKKQADDGKKGPGCGQGAGEEKEEKEEATIMQKV
jgi:hypothetical protein